MSENVLKADSLTRVFEMGERNVIGIRGVNLEVERGESIAIKGPSGSGKTTLLTILGCLDRPTEGRLAIDGLDVTDLSEGQLSEIRSKKIGFVFQSFNLMPFLNAQENVELPMELTGLTKQERRDKAKALLATVGLADRGEHRPNKLSAGEQQRVAIARALANDPAILLADEPTGNLDSKNKMEIVRLLRKLNQEHGMTTIMVTHDNRVASMMGRVVFIKDGTVRSNKKQSVQTLPGPEDEEDEE
ncbi:MAG: ABC transporter ATP-binding protein [Methanomassiliicoccus sp.]|nr:ABC transporter ATP-binding protein [Methanomassiliicoccus sp.]